jgi:tetratricopeptide (TPR) repeat protein
MRWLVVTLAAVLLVPAAAGAQQAWVKAYEDGIELFEKGGNDALAEQKLVEARDKGPKQSRRHNYHSVVFRPFIPDFYLGLIYVRTGRLKQGQDLLERALRDQLVKPDDKTYPLAQASLQRVRDEQTRLASNTPRPNPPEVAKPPVTTTPPATTTQPSASNIQAPASTTQTTPANAANTTTTPPPVRSTPTPPVVAEPAWLPAFRRSMEAARASLGERRYAEARSSLAAASDAAGDAARRREAQTLRLEIDAAQNRAAQAVVERARNAIGRKDATAATSEVATLRDLAPAHAAIPELTRGISTLVDGLDRTAKLANAERTGVKLFLSGKYQESAATLEQAVGSGISSPRIHLFLASSRAAQALLASPDDQPALAAAARKHYELAKPHAATLRADQRFISPSIQKLLSSGS